MSTTPITIEMIDEKWDEFNKMANRVEQCWVPHMILIVGKLRSLHRDLHENWNEEHADTFMKVLEQGIKTFG